MGIKQSVILYSGGMDSTVALFRYADSVRMALSFNYGSKHNEREIACARKNCALLGIEHRVVKLDLGEMGFVSDLLLTGGEIPEGHYHDLSMRRTVVPFRNGVMLSIAAGIAESAACSQIIISNHAGDHAIYPDCRAEFIESMTAAISAGTYNNVKIFAPFTFLTKRDIALIGKELNVPFADSYSCYKGGEQHCGVCGTCIERREALAGFDTTDYEK